MWKPLKNLPGLGPADLYPSLDEHPRQSGPPPRPRACALVYGIRQLGGCGVTLYIYGERTRGTLTALLAFVCVYEKSSKGVVERAFLLLEETRPESPRGLWPQPKLCSVEVQRRDTRYTMRPHYTRHCATLMCTASPWSEPPPCDGGGDRHVEVEQLLLLDLVEGAASPSASASPTPTGRSPRRARGSPRRADRDRATLRDLLERGAPA